MIFQKMKEEKINEIKKSIEHHNKQIIQFESEIIRAQSNLENSKDEIHILEARLSSMEPNLEPNGYLFFVSEKLNDTKSLPEDLEKLIFDKVSKIKSINAKGFMKLFTESEYEISIGKSVDGNIEKCDPNSLSDEIKNMIYRSASFIEEGKIIYRGDFTWHEVLGSFLKNGFSQSSEFDKICGGNSYFNNNTKSTF